MSEVLVARDCTQPELVYNLGVIKEYSLFWLADWVLRGQRERKSGEGQPCYQSANSLKTESTPSRSLIQILHLWLDLAAARA